MAPQEDKAAPQEDPILLKVSVELAQDAEPELLCVRRSDLSAETPGGKSGIARLAEEFCMQHALDLAKVQKPLEEHIRENVAAAHLEINTSGEGTSKKKGSSSKPGSRDGSRDRGRGDIPDLGRGATPSTSSRSAKMQYPPMSGNLERILNRMAQPKSSAENYKGATTTTTGDTRHLPEARQRNMVEKLGVGRSSRSREVFRRLHQDHAERKIRIDIQRRVEQQQRERASGKLQKELQGGAVYSGGGDRSEERGGFSLDDSGREQQFLRSGNSSQTQQRTGSASSKRAKNPLERLYRDAKAIKARKERKMQEKEELENFEISQYTFKPAIHPSQSRVAGHSNFDSANPARRSERAREKVEQLRQQRLLCEMQDCTFKPHIDERSHDMMERRIARLKIQGSLFEHLYEDAKRREERMIEYANLVSPEVTFKPDIGNDKYRPPLDDNVEDFFTRLATQRTYARRDGHQRSTSPRRGGDEKVNYPPGSGSAGATGANKSASRGDEQSLPPACSFAPQVGRPPNFARNEEGKPIGDFLYEVGQYVRYLKEEIVEAKQQEDNRARMPQMGQVSRLVFAEKKRRKYLEIFHLLSDGAGVVSGENFKVELVPEGFHEFLRPVQAYLEETGSRFDFEGFSVTLDYVLEKTGIPSSHLFTAAAVSEGGGGLTATGSTAAGGSTVGTIMGSSRGFAHQTPRGARTPLKAGENKNSYTPRLDRKSIAIANQKYALSGEPVHDRLQKMDQKYKERRTQRMEEKEAAEMLECTFAPNRVRNDGQLRLTPRGPLGASSSFKPPPRGTHDFQMKEVDDVLQGAGTAVRDAAAAVERTSLNTTAKNSTNKLRTSGTGGGVGGTISPPAGGGPPSMNTRKSGASSRGSKTEDRGTLHDVPPTGPVVARSSS
ncbi:unnamed protein product [Amoebophrya sp. A25]|nr:unnamed protein product [Amoebophrya sp. A25]|eukprot:GSA25T00017778001.1